MIADDEGSDDVSVLSEMRVDQQWDNVIAAKLCELLDGEVSLSWSVMRWVSDLFGFLLWL